jgi:hypothetical protein
MSLILGILDSGGAAAGGGASYESIATVNGTGSSSTIVFNSIPGTYTHLQLRGISRSTTATTTLFDLEIRLNADGGNNYSRHMLYGTGAAVAATGAASQNTVEVSRQSVPGNSVTSGIMGVTIVDIHDYASTTKNKTVRSIGGSDTNGGGSISLASGVWMNTNAVTSITIYGTGSAANFTSTTTFSLYGIKG